MAFDPILAGRLRACLQGQRGFTEKKMFGGLAFLLHSHMCVGVWKSCLIARVGPDAYQAGLREQGAREFNITGKAMTGWVMVEPMGTESDDDLHHWIDQSVRFVETLPPK